MKLATILATAGLISAQLSGTAASVLNNCTISSDTANIEYGASTCSEGTLVHGATCTQTCDQPVSQLTRRLLALVAVKEQLAPTSQTIECNNGTLVVNDSPAQDLDCPAVCPPYSTIASPGAQEVWSSSCYTGAYEGEFCSITCDFATTSGSGQIECGSAGNWIVPQEPLVCEVPVGCDAPYADEPWIDGCDQPLAHGQECSAKCKQVSSSFLLASTTEGHHAHTLALDSVRKIPIRVNRITCNNGTTADPIGGSCAAVCGAPNDDYVDFDSAFAYGGYEGQKFNKTCLYGDDKAPFELTCSSNGTWTGEATCPPPRRCAPYSGFASLSCDRPKQSDSNEFNHDVECRVTCNRPTPIVREENEGQNPVDQVPDNGAGEEVPGEEGPGVVEVRPLVDKVIGVIIEEPANYDGEITCVDGSWVGAGAGLCKAACDGIPAPSNGRTVNVNCTNGGYDGEGCTQECTYGRIEGDRTRTCGPDGWSGRGLQCRAPRNCTGLGQLSNGLGCEDGTEHGDECRQTCTFSNVLVKRECVDGELTGIAPKCPGKQRTTRAKVLFRLTYTDKTVANWTDADSETHINDVAEATGEDKRYIKITSITDGSVQVTTEIESLDPEAVKSVLRGTSSSGSPTFNAGTTAPVQSTDVSDPVVEDDDGANVGAIVGGVIGGLVGFALIGGLLYLLCVKRRQQSEGNTNTNEAAADTAEPAAAEAKEEKPVEEIEMTTEAKL